MPNATARANARTTSVPLVLRRRMEAAVEKLIAFLDALEEPDMDREDDDPAEVTGDGEPSLGSTHNTDQSKAWGASHAGDDLEFEGDGVAECDREDGYDREDDPSESGIGDEDGLKEQTVGEPSLGYTDDVDQAVALDDDRAAYTCDLEATGTVEDILCGLPWQLSKANREAADAVAQAALSLRYRRPIGRACGYPIVGTVR